VPAHMEPLTLYRRYDGVMPAQGCGTPRGAVVSRGKLEI
jgi:hypothetical protein